MKSKRKKEREREKEKRERERVKMEKSLCRYTHAQREREIVRFLGLLKFDRHRK